MTKCPSGHDSTDNDFCSTCGTEMAPSVSPGGASVVPTTVAAPKSAAATTGGTGQNCPTCHTERDDLNARYCGVCAHDFETGRAGSIPTDLGQDVVVPQATTAVPVGTAAAASTSGARLDLTARVNESAANAPQGEPERKYNLIDEESLIGRASSSNGAAIGVVGDSAVSKRHAIITRHDDGSFTIRDAGSTNGTRLDGKDLTAHVEYPLAVGAVIELGEWTLLTVTAIKSA